MRKLYFTLAILIMAYNGHVTAQSCSGEIMHFRETFGAGTSTAPLATGRTNYVYKGSGALSDGDYHLKNNTQGRPEWHSVTDHTGDANGRMMVTNASYTPGEFYRDTVYSLTSTKTYSVYFYAMNVNTVGTCSPNPILPRLELVVESYNADGTFTQLGSMISNDLPQTNPATWVRIAGTYYLPVDVTAIRYRIINNATGGCGNDIAIDDITFSQCQPVILAASGLTLKGTKEKNAVSLNWSARDEYASFDIEKSENGSTWTFLKNVKATGSKQYSAEVHTSSDKKLEYRISAISNNGQRYHSNVITVKENSRGSSISTYPNPFFNELKVQLNADKDMPLSSVRIFDLRGKLISTQSWNIRAGDNNLTLNKNSLQPGIYFLSLVDRNGAVISQQRVVKK